jgi:5-methylcytosine-specific restriction endonuclease McrA
MTVLVLDHHHQPLMPCTEQRARLLLARHRAVVHRRMPFVIRLRDRAREASSVQDVALKLDPGSKTTGMALVRHRTMRFQNRRRGAQWLPPSLRSRLGNILTWGRRFQRWAPISRIHVEHARFDTHLLHHREVAGVAYQHGDLFGWEIRAYVLEKFGHRCAYCHREHGPFELDHIFPRSRGGSNRVSNLALSCHSCNAAKGNLSAAEWGHPEVEARAKAPLKDAAALNASRSALEQRQVRGLAPAARRLCVWTRLKRWTALPPQASNAGACAPL